MLKILLSKPSFPTTQPQLALLLINDHIFKQNRRKKTAVKRKIDELEPKMRHPYLICVSFVLSIFNW